MTEAPAVGRYRGPSALGEGVRRFASLTFMLAATDFKLRWFGSALGYVWTLMKPLLLFGVLYLVFTRVVKFGKGVENYPVYLLAAIVLFTYFSETTSRGVTSLVDRDNLLRKIRFPRLVIPLAVALHSLFNLCLNMIAVFVFVFAAGIDPSVDWLQLPLLVAMMVVLATGVTMLLSALYVRYRDIEPIWEVALQLLFYASPVIYVVGTIPDEHLRKVAVMNPIGTILTQMRHALVDPSAPTAITELGGWQWLIVPVGISVAVFALGWWVFMREAPRIAENL
jgi:ABC-2 type transport system permease protein